MGDEEVTYVPPVENVPEDSNEAPTDEPTDEVTEEPSQEPTESTEEEPSQLDLDLAAYSYPDPGPFQASALFDAIRDQRADKVKEIGPESNLSLRGEDGQTYLHYAYNVRSDLDLIKELLPFSDISERDENGDSVIDLALRNQDYYGEDFLKVVDEYLNQMLLGGESVRLENMVLGGMEVPRPTSAKRDEIKAASEDTDFVLESLQGIEERISQLHSAVHQGDLDGVKQALEKKKLAKGRDVTGMIPLHKAVVFQHEPIVEYLAEEFPVLIDVTDHMGRTALHYAAVCDNEKLYQILLDNGAVEDATDIKGKTPADYKADKTLIELNDVQEKILEKTAEIRKTMRSRPTTAERRARSGMKVDVREDESRASRHSTVIPAYDPKRDPFLAEKAPPPNTPETKYVAEHMGEPLTLALAEIVDKRPWDPIEFLAQWLIHYSRQSKYQAKMKEENDRLEAEREAALNEEEREKKCLDEMEEIKAEEERLRQEEAEKQRLKELEEKRKQESSLTPPDLPTVAEESEAEPDSARHLEPKPGLRDQNGQTELHRAAATEDSNLAELLEGGSFDISLRDVNGKTAYQLADEAGLQANKDLIDGHIQQIIDSGNADQLTLLVLNGYENLPDLDEKYPDLEGLNEDIQTVWKARQEAQDTLAKAREAVAQGDLEELSNNLTTVAQAKAQNEKGRTVLHEAVLNIRKDVVEHIVDNYKECINVVDSYDRSALHYAAAIDGSIYTALRLKEADEALADIFGNMAAYYIDNRGEIFNAVEGLEELVEVHIASLAAEIVEAADGIEASVEKRVSEIDAGELEAAAEATEPAEVTEEAAEVTDEVQEAVEVTEPAPAVAQEETPDGVAQEEAEVEEQVEETEAEADAE